LYSELRFQRYEFYKIKTFAAIFGKLKRDLGLFSPTGSLMGGAMLSGWNCKKIGDLLPQDKDSNSGSVVGIGNQTTLVSNQICLEVEPDI
jgi:hypothetical protein